jgi:hypothetical protein
MPGVVNEAVQCSPSSCCLSSHVDNPGAFEQPIQELLLSIVLHAVRATSSARPRQKPSVLPARPRNCAHATLQRSALFAQLRMLALLAQLRMLTQRACVRSAHVRAAAHASAARTLTQRSSGARYLRSRTRCRRSDRAPPVTGSHYVSLTSISLTSKHLSILHSTRFACA